jgi:hypothetical protein
MKAGPSARLFDPVRADLPRFFDDRGISPLTLSARPRDETFDFAGNSW